MIWKRWEGVTIDLRRPREEAGGLSTLRRLALQFGMTLAGALVVAVWVLFLLTMIEPRDLPFTIEAGGLTRWITCEVTDPSQGLQDYDQILAVDGRPVGSEYFSPDRTDRLDPAKVRDFSQSLYGRTTATLLVRRVVPNPEGRFACDGSWYNGTSEDTLSIEISTTRSISYGAFVDLLGRAIAVLVLALGFLALRARSSDAATPYFISVCILAGVAFSATLPARMMTGCWPNRACWILVLARVSSLPCRPPVPTNSCVPSLVTISPCSVTL